MTQVRNYKYDTQEIKERNTVSLCKGQVELNIKETVH